MLRYLHMLLPPPFLFFYRHLPSTHLPRRALAPTGNDGAAYAYKLSPPLPLIAVSMMPRRGYCCCHLLILRAERADSALVCA